MVDSVKLDDLDCDGREAESFTDSKLLIGASKHNWPSDHIITQDGRTLKQRFFDFLKNESLKNVDLGKNQTGSSVDHALPETSQGRKCSVCENKQIGGKV